MTFPLALHAVVISQPPIALAPSKGGGGSDVGPFAAIFCKHSVLPNEAHSRYHIYLVYRNYAIF